MYEQDKFLNDLKNLFNKYDIEIVCIPYHAPMIQSKKFSTITSKYGFIQLNVDENLLK